MKKSAFLIFMFGLLQFSIAQTNRFIPYKIKNDVWVYVHPSSSMPVISEEYQMAFPFNYLGLAKVKIEDKWKWIDTTGKYVFTEYDSAQYLQKHDYFIVYKNNKAGIYSVRKKLLIVTLQYDGIEVLDYKLEDNSTLRSLPTFQNSEFDLLGLKMIKGKIKKQLIQIGYNIGAVRISPDWYDNIEYNDFQSHDFEGRFFTSSIDNKIGILENNGQKIVPAEFNEIQCVNTIVPNKVNPMRFYIVVKNNNYGLYNYIGQSILNPTYTSISQLENCHFPIFRLQNKSDLNGLCFGVTSKTTEPAYLRLHFEETTQMVVCRDKKWIDIFSPSGEKILTNLETDQLKKLNTQLYAFQNVKNQFGILWNSKNMVLDADYDEIKGIGSEKVVAIRKKNKWALFFLDKKQLGAFDFTFIGKLSDVGLINASNEKNQFGYINESGIWVIPAKYTNSLSFNQNSPLKTTIVDEIKVAPVALNGKYGFIDVKGNPFIQFEYDSAQPFSGLIAAVKSKNGWQVIGKGKKLMNRTYQRVRIVSGVALIYHKDSSGVLDFEGKWIFPMTKKAIYNIIDHSTDGFPFQRIQDELSFTQVAVISNTGQLIAKLEDFNIDEIDSKSWLLLGKKQSMVVDNKGTVVDLKVTGEFEWINPSHQLGVFKLTEKNGAKYRYFNVNKNTIENGLNDLKIEYVDDFTPLKVTKNNQVGFIGNEFKLYLPAVYTSIQPVYFTDNLVFIVNNNQGHYGIVNSKNEFLIPFNNQFIHQTLTLIETKWGQSHCSVICIKMSSKNAYYLFNNNKLQLLYEEFENLNNGFDVISETLFQVTNAEKEILNFVDSKGIKYFRK